MHPLAFVPRHPVALVLAVAGVVAAAGVSASSGQSSATMSVTVTVVRTCTIGLNGVGLACGGGEEAARVGFEGTAHPTVVRSWTGGAPRVAGPETVLFTIDF